jgi:hypothetical protein
MLGIALAVALSAACDDLEPCDAQGDTQPCECAGGAPGAQRCLPEQIWSACDCTAEPAPEGGGGGVSGGAGGAGGRSGSGAGAGGASGAGGARPPAGGAGDDDDAGMDPDPAGAGGSSGAGAGGASGMGGNGGAAGPMSAAYRGCMDTGDCDPGAACLMSPVVLVDPSRVCAPACGNADDCPVPEGSYDADVSCVAGRCRIDCTEVDAFPLPRSCPANMLCVADEFPSATSYCYDDGL